MLWGTRVVVPPAGCTQVVEELHEGHLGVSHMKSLARSFVWWPGMDHDLEAKVKSCQQCQITRHSPPPAPLHPWEWPQCPWVRIHVDYAGPFLGKMFLVVIDSHSKWMEVEAVSAATSAITIEKLRAMFAIHGLPELLVSDNGSCFISVEFQQFMTRNGIRHVKVAPYHPASNGLAERAVQTFKEGMKKIKTDSIQCRLSRFLFHYQITPHTTTGVPPAELLMGRHLRSHLDFLCPNVAGRVCTKQQKQKVGHDQIAQQRQFHVGDNVFIRNFSLGPKWLPGSILEERGPCSFIIELEDGQNVRQHIDHIRIRTVTVTTPPDGAFDDVPTPAPSPDDQANDRVVVP